MLFSRSKYYQSIDDCTAFAFNEALSKGKIESLCVAGKCKEKEAFKAWEKIISQYIDVFGIPEGYKEYLRKKLSAVKMYERAFVKGQKGYEIHGQLMEAEANKMMNIGTGQKFELLTAQVSKGMGFIVDPSKVTVRQFYGYVNLLQKK